MRTLTASVLVWGALALAACSGQVDGGGSAGGGGGSAGAGGGSAGGSGGNGGAGICEDSNEVVDFKITTFDGVVHACSELTNGDVTVEGAITASTGTTYTIDSCQFDANCMPMLNTLEVTSSALNLAIPVGTLVSVSARFSHLGGVCNAGLFVKNLMMWGGQANPTTIDEAPWLDTGGPNSPFDLSTQVRCTYGEGGDPPCTGGTSVYDLSFALTTDPSITIGPIVTGTTVTWDVPSGPVAGSYAVRNAQANSGYCEIPGTVEYFIARNPPP